MLKRILLVSILAGLFTSSASATEKHVLVVKSMSVPIIDTHVGLFEKHLSRLSIADGLSYRISYLNAGGDREKIRNDLELILNQERRPDLIVSSATLATQEVHSKLKSVQGNVPPQVYFTVTDPWGAGVIDETSRLSGVPFYLPSEVKVKLAKRLLGSATTSPVRIGFVHTTYPSDLSDRKRVKTALESSGMEFHPISLEYRAVGDHLEDMLVEVRRQAKALAPSIDYWWLAKGPLGERAETVSALYEVADIPVLYGNGRAAVENGAIFFANVSDEESMKIAAGIARDFLNGSAIARASQAVMGQSYELFFNISAAVKAGLVIPSDLMAIASKNQGVIRGNKNP